MSGRFAALFVACIALGVSQVAARGASPPIEPSVRELHATRSGDGVRVSFEVVGAFSEELLERIHSGIPVAFRHRIDVEAPKRFALAPTRTLARTIVETRVSFDALTNRYALSRITALRRPHRKQAPPALEETTVTESLELARTWMSRCTDVALYDPAGAIEGEDLRVSVETTLGRRYILWVLPARSTVGARHAVEP